MHGHHNSSASDYGSIGDSSGHVTPQHLASNQQSHTNLSMGHQYAMGPDGSASAGKHDDSRDMYQRPYQSASGSSADYSTGGGNLDVSNKKTARYAHFTNINYSLHSFIVLACQHIGFFPN